MYLEAFLSGQKSSPSHFDYCALKIFLCGTATTCRSVQRLVLLFFCIKVSKKRLALHQSFHLFPSQRISFLFLKIIFLKNRGGYFYSRVRRKAEKTGNKDRNKFFKIPVLGKLQLILRRKTYCCPNIFLNSLTRREILFNIWTFFLVTKRLAFL